MSEPTPEERNPSPDPDRVEITDDEATALYQAMRRRDNGTGMIVQNVLYSIEDAPDLGRNLLDVVVRLIGHMTPEQRSGLREQLPELFAEVIPNGVPHSAAG